MIFDPTAASGELSLFLFDDTGQVAYRSVNEFLRERWVTARHTAISDAIMARIRAVRERQLRGMSVAELMDAFPKPSLVVRAFAGELWGRGPASSNEIAAVAARVGRPLPGDLVAAWSFANGHERSGLLPTASVVPASAASQENQQRAIDIAVAAGMPDVSLAGCWFARAGR